MFHDYVDFEFWECLIRSDSGFQILFRKDNTYLWESVLYENFLTHGRETRKRIALAHPEDYSEKSKHFHIFIIFVVLRLR